MKGAPQNDNELLAMLGLPHHMPRWKPTSIPTSRWDDSPCLCLAVNDQWFAHILGLLGMLDQPDTWIGNEAEINAARQQVGELIACWMEGKMGCGCGENQTITNIQFLPDGTMQVSYDGGLTWQDAPPGVDPRYSGSVGIPVPGENGNDKRCQAAGSATETMRDQQEQMSDDASAWSGITGMMSALITLLIFIGIIGSGGALTPLLLAFSAAVLGAGQAAFEAAFNDNVWKVVQCAIYCHTTADGQTYTAADVSAIRAEISGNLETGVAALFIDKTLEVWGATGLTNASRAGFISPIDCTDCTCEACSMWELTYPGNPIYGTIDTSHIGSDGYFDVATAQINANNIYYVDVRTPAIDQCCHLTPGQIEILTGGNETFGSFVQCCNAVFSDVAFENLGSASCDCFMHLQIQCAVPFTARVHLEDCP